ncbi:uncharacterized protein LOC111010162 [Momordica charantia]|uniref:Uncharacterized protein LOC111010162 n=1 Tax=Momordica charantia TaxID=3673 RepID=A0A6J1CC87_MOMCH|nr:uncharacterized protein LOC111010162 [Momordica charantia]
MASAGVRLKHLIDSKEQRVLFGEADQNFIDFLFNLLSLPLGTVVRQLKKQGMVGCLGNLYESVETLNDTYLQPNQSKDSLLKPTFYCGSSAMLLPDDTDSSTSTTFYVCQPNSYEQCIEYFADDPNAICPVCNVSMSKRGRFVKPHIGKDEEGGFVKGGGVTYMVMDDLSVIPMSAISCLALLNKFNVTKVGGLEEKIITLDVNEGVKLLRASLQSNTILTDVFFGRMKTTTPKSCSSTPNSCSSRKGRGGN